MTDLVDMMSLLCLCLEQLLHCALHNLSSFFHTPGKRGQRLLQFGPHLGANVLMLFGHLFNLTSDGI